VPNLTFGAGVVKSLRPHSKMVFDAHLMVENPEIYIESFKKAGADYFTFHLEAAEDPQKVIDAVKAAGMKCGISVKPKTDVKGLLPYLDQLDLVLVMSVEPGFGGQSFMEDMLEKSAWLKARKKENDYSYLIEIDGGINRETAVKAVKSGVEVLVAGTAVFGAENIEEEVKYYTSLSIDSE
ncbi:MAG: ribulose-phosphate 3-epimerase, partial [Firmicutes bacterium]|nr:ribulose-phosphate 3-epimerase [Bacillota bacterium]